MYYQSIRWLIEFDKNRPDEVQTNQSSQEGPTHRRTSSSVLEDMPSPPSYIIRNY